MQLTMLQLVVNLQKSMHETMSGLQNSSHCCTKYCLQEIVAAQSFELRWQGAAVTAAEKTCPVVKGRKEENWSPSMQGSHEGSHYHGA